MTPEECLPDRQGSRWSDQSVQTPAPVQKETIHTVHGQPHVSIRRFNGPVQLIVRNLGRRTIGSLADRLDDVAGGLYREIRDGVWGCEGWRSLQGDPRRRLGMRRLEVSTGSPETANGDERARGEKSTLTEGQW